MGADQELGDWGLGGTREVYAENKWPPLRHCTGLFPGWSWEYAGEVHITSSSIKLELEDLTGFNGRADAIYFNREKTAPPRQMKELSEWRKTLSNEASEPETVKEYDLVIVGGGIA